MYKNVLKALIIASLMLFFSSRLQASTFTPTVSGVGTWEATLQARDLDGNLATAEAYYDTVLDITWMMDPFDHGVVHPQFMFWDEALALAANLDPFGSGITGWRLPTHNVALSEYEHLFITTLGNTPVWQGGALINAGPFEIIPGIVYFTSEADGAGRPFVMNATGVEMQSISLTNDATPWSVHNGDVGAAVSSVPIPAAAWLLASGLIGMLGVVRRTPSPRS